MYCTPSHLKSPGDKSCCCVFTWPGCVVTWPDCAELSWPGGTCCEVPCCTCCCAAEWWEAGTCCATECNGSACEVTFEAAGEVTCCCSDVTWFCCVVTWFCEVIWVGVMEGGEDERCRTGGWRLCRVVSSAALSGLPAGNSVGSYKIAYSYWFSMSFATAILAFYLKVEKTCT